MMSVILSWDILFVLFAPLVLARFAWHRKWRMTAVILVLFSVLLLVAIVAPSYKKARPTAYKNACIANLKYLAEAKGRWAAESKPEASALVQSSDLAPFLKGGFMPICPAGGTYIFGAVNEPPRCSHADKGHSLNPTR